MIRTNRPLQFGEWSGAGQRQSAVTSQCHGLHAGHNVATVYPIDKVGKSFNLQIWTGHLTHLQMFFRRDYKTIWRVALQLLCHG